MKPSNLPPISLPLDKALRAQGEATKMVGLKDVYICTHQIYLTAGAGLHLIIKNVFSTIIKIRNRHSREMAGPVGLT